MKPHEITVTVNRRTYTRTVPPRLTLVDFLRHELNLKGTHIGCEHGVCGACTVIVNGVSVRSCLMLAVQANDATVRTVEGLQAESGELHPLQEAFRDHHGLQCGYCTPGMLMTLVEFLEENPSPTDDELRDAISGNLCRCTGYQRIIEAALDAADRLSREGR